MIGHSDYVNMRVPKTEYEKLKQARETLKLYPAYSWVENLALGAFIGLLAGLALKELSVPQDDHAR